MNSKKIFLPLIILVIIILVSCTEIEVETDGPAGTYEEVVNWEDTGELEFDSNGNVVFKNVKINLHTISAGKDLAGLIQLMQRFNNAHQGKINVEVTNEGQGSYYDSLTRRISTDAQVPELAMFHSEYLPTMQMSHLFQPMDRILEATNLEFNIEDYYQGVTSNSYIGNKLYGIPLDGHSELIVYRADLLRKYGKEVPSNFNELLDTAYAIQEEEKKTNNDFKGISISTAQFGVTQYAFFTGILQNGGSLVSENGWPNWTNSDNKNAIKQTLTNFKKLFYGDKAVSTVGTAVEEPNADFANLKSAFSFVYTWELTDLLTAFKVMNDKDDDEWGVMSLSNLLASNTSRDYASNIFGISHQFVIPKNISDWNKKAAAAYVAKWISENSAPEWTATGHVPMNKNVYTSDQFNQHQSTINYISHFGNPEDYITFPHVYYITPLLEGLQKIFIAGVRSEETNIDNLIERYNEEAISIIQSLI